MNIVTRRSFAVTFRGPENAAVAKGLRDLDEVIGQLQALAAQGLCEFQDTLSAELPPARTVAYRAVYEFFKSLGTSSRSRIAANIMQALFKMCTPAGERLVRFYCTDYHHEPGICTCNTVTLPPRQDARQIRYRSICDVRVAHWWLMDRDDLLALTDEQLAAVEVHPNTRQHLMNFIVWLRANPQAY